VGAAERRGHVHGGAAVEHDGALARAGQDGVAKALVKLLHPMANSLQTQG
jgi:hypothetical protein